ncbi:MAG: TIGR00730 family Rossman fold protein [Rhodospirillales bacterium]|jgi:hypothetical protein|nr:TIGR00730 family Rossman fold protein [Rhodospirillales bacterium]
MSQFRSISVFCGSKSGDDPAFREAAIRLGIDMARRGRRLIYGGGSIGLMGILADAVLAAGGDVIGVIPDFLIRHEVGHRRLTEMVITGSMHDRKRRMFELSDGFVVLPGGLGTLDETIEILTWKQLRLHDRPVVILDVNGYWQPLLGLMRSVIGQGFAHPAIADLYTVVDDADAVLAALEVAPTVTAEVLTSHL